MLDGPVAGFEVVVGVVEPLPDALSLLLMNVSAAWPYSWP